MEVKKFLILFKKDTSNPNINLGDVRKLIKVFSNPHFFSKFFIRKPVILNLLVKNGWFSLIVQHYLKILQSFRTSRNRFIVVSNYLFSADGSVPGIHFDLLFLFFIEPLCGDAFGLGVEFYAVFA